MSSTRLAAIGCGTMAVLLVTAGCGQSADDRPASWSYISTIIIQPNCATANCHATITQRANIDLSTIQRGYDSLVGQGYAVPGDPNSPLLSVLRATGKTYRRMPPDFALPNDDINLIERWIVVGAPR
jgi:hypothetical protein